MVDDDRMPLAAGEQPKRRKVQVPDARLLSAVRARSSRDADTLAGVIAEMLLARTSERQGRVIDHDQAASMEKKKQEGYF